MSDWAVHPWMPGAEEWRPVVGFEGAYEVSDRGQVRSLSRFLNRSDGRNYAIAGRVLKTWLAHGYPTVNLSANGRRKTYTTHILVCEAWHGPRPEGMFARHLDDVPTNIWPSNLAWGTPADNAQDALRNGRNKFRNQTHCRSGHEFVPSNTAYTSMGHRRCMQCAREFHRERRARLRREREAGAR